MSTNARDDHLLLIDYTVAECFLLTMVKLAKDVRANLTYPVWVDKATHIDKTVVVVNIITTVSSQYTTSYDVN